MGFGVVCREGGGLLSKRLRKTELSMQWYTKGLISAFRLGACCQQFPYPNKCNSYAPY